MQAMAIFYAYIGLILCTCFPVAFGCRVDQHQDWAVKRLTILGRNYSLPCQALSGGFTESELLKFRSLKAFLFQNDERELLSDWLQYHAYLFGIENLHIVDHLSTDKNICQLLTLFSICGSKVTSFERSFSGKNAILSKVMRKESSSILIPVDADEFVTFVADTGGKDHVSFNRDIILPRFMELPMDGHKYKFKEVLPVRLDIDVCDHLVHNKSESGVYRRTMHTSYTGKPMYNMNISKTFFYSEGFLATDQGNHIGLAVMDSANYGNDAVSHSDLRNYIISNVSLIHLSVSSYESFKRKIIRGADAYGYTEDTDCATACSGKHYRQRAKAVRHNDTAGVDMYRRECRAHSSGQKFTTMHDWFRTYALTLEEIVGADTADDAEVGDSKATGLQYLYKLIFG